MESSALLARLDERVEGIVKSLEKIDSSMRRVEDKVDDLLLWRSRIKGQVSLLTYLVALALSSVGAVIVIK